MTLRVFLEHLLANGVAILALAVCFAGCLLAASICYAANVGRLSAQETAETLRYEQVENSPLSFDRKTGEFVLKRVQAED